MLERVVACADRRVGVQRSMLVAIILPFQRRNSLVVQLHDFQQVVAQAYRF